jgi:hypothetical protein
MATPVTYSAPRHVRETVQMAGDRANKQERKRVAHYVCLFALWVLLVGLGFAANHFASNGDDSADFAYVLFTASVAVALLDQLWKMKP